MTNIVPFPSTPEMVDRKAARDVAAFLVKHLAGAPKSARATRHAARYVSRKREHFDLAKDAFGIVSVQSGRGEWYWALPGEAHLVPYAMPLNLPATSLLGAAAHG